MTYTWDDKQYPLPTIQRGAPIILWPNTEPTKAVLASGEIRMLRVSGLHEQPHVLVSNPNRPFEGPSWIQIVNTNLHQPKRPVRRGSR